MHLLHKLVTFTDLFIVRVLREDYHLTKVVSCGRHIEIFNTSVVLQSRM